jgi:outer membrane protein TolC
MGEEADQSYVVEDSLSINAVLTPADSTLLASRNPSLDVQRINMDIARYDKRIATTYLFPTISVSAGYNYSRTVSDASLLQSNRSLGPSAGLGLSVPIFHGGTIRRNIKVASLNELSAELQYDRQEREISRQYRSAWTAYQSAIATYNLEAENRGYARENLDIQQARFRVGVATSIEMREAENSYIATLARYYNAAYNAKVAETRVLEIEARLAE